MLKNLIVYGKAGTGKTTYLIELIQKALKENPNLKIRVYEEYPEIEGNITNVISINNLSEKLDLFVYTCNCYKNDLDLMKTACRMNIPVWIEICGDDREVEKLKVTLGNLKDFETKLCAG